MKEWMQRTELLLGSDRIERLRNARVLVVGLGGVGAYAAEAIARAGVGTMTIADADAVFESNINRQLPALHSTVGEPKAEVMARRLLDINPGLRLTVVRRYIRDEETETLLDEGFDYVVDAIDTVSGKLALVEQAKAALEEVGLQARVYGEGGTVTAQLPGSGAVVASGSTILLYAGKEPSADKETMPDLTNLSYQTARDRMAALGLYIKTNSSITDTAQIVSGQTVAAGTQLDHGTVVEVTLVTSDSSMLGRY